MCTWDGHYIVKDCYLKRIINVKGKPISQLLYFLLPFHKTENSGDSKSEKTKHPLMYFQHLSLSTLSDIEGGQW